MSERLPSMRITASISAMYTLPIVTPRARATRPSGDSWNATPAHQCRAQTAIHHITYATSTHPHHASALRQRPRTGPMSPDLLTPKSSTSHAITRSTSANTEACVNTRSTR